MESNYLVIKIRFERDYFFLVFELSAAGGLKVASLPMTMIMVAKTLSSSFLLSFFPGDLFKVTLAVYPSQGS